MLGGEAQAKSPNKDFFDKLTEPDGFPSGSVHFSEIKPVVTRVTGSVQAI